MLPVAPVTRCIADPFDRWTGVPRAVVNKAVVPSNGCRDHRDVFLSASDEQRDDAICTCVSRAVGRAVLEPRAGDPSDDVSVHRAMAWDAGFVGAVAHHRRRACAG